MVLAALFTYVLDTARAGFELLLSIGAGTGLLYLLRWFWWRINAWSEIAAMATSFCWRRTSSSPRAAAAGCRRTSASSSPSASRRWSGWPSPT
jgi:hypothetical protein